MFSYILIITLWGHTATQTIVFVEEPADTLVISGDDTQLNCSFQEDFAPVSVVWYKDTDLLAENRVVSPLYEDDYDVIGGGNEHHLRMYKVTNETEDTYSCGDKWITNERRDADVFVIENRPSCTVEPNVTIIADNNVMFSCIMDLDDSAPGDLVWYQNGAEVMRKTGMENIWMTVLYKNNDGDVFDCQLEHYTLPRPKWSNVSCEEKISMDVQFAASLEILISGNADPSGKVIEGDSCSATCIVLESNPEVESVTWTDSNNEIVDEDEVLSFPVITRDSSGEYTCEAINTFWDGTTGTGKNTTNIDVQYSPDVNISTNISVDCVVEGKDYFMECHADGNPVPYVFWVTPNDEIVRDSLLVIDNIQSNQNGEYVCNATNIFWNNTPGSSTSAVMVPEVVTLADVSLESSSGSVDAGSTVGLVCTATGGTNVPFNLEIQHIENEYTVTEGNDTTLKYTISEFNEIHEGSYICIATTRLCDNTDGTSESNVIKLDLSGSNSIWIIVIILAVVGITVATIAVGIWYKKKKQRKTSVVGSPSTNGRGYPDGYDSDNVEHTRGNDYDPSPYGVSTSFITPVVNTPKDVQPSTSVSDPNIDQMYAQPHKKRAPARKDVQPSTSVNDPNIDQMYAQPHKKRASAKKAPDYNPENLVYAELSHAPGKLVLPRARLDHGLASPTEYASVDMSKLK